MNFARKVLAAPFKAAHVVVSVTILSALIGLGVTGIAVLALGAAAVVIFGIVALLAWLGLALILGLIAKAFQSVAQVFDPSYSKDDKIAALREKVSNINKPSLVN